MKRISVIAGCLAALAAAGMAYAQQAVTVAAPGSITVTCSAPATTTGGGSSGGGGTTTPPPANTFWLYKAGKFVGAGDYSYGSGLIMYGAASVVVSGDEAWQPRMPGDDLNTAPYTKVTVSIKPTQAGWFAIGGEMLGDKVIPGSNGMVDLRAYGPNPMKLNQWNVFTVPLSAMSIPKGTFHLYKIGFQGHDIPNPNSNKYEVDAVGFIP